MSPSRSGAHKTVSTWPGRPFFMVPGVTYTSRAPCSSRREQAKARASGVMSSMLHTSSRISPLASSAVSPRKARTQLACSNCLVPMPTPTARAVITGMGLKDWAKWVSRAAPVGVHSSPRTVPP